MSEIDIEALRMVEALLFAAEEPLDVRTLENRLPRAVEIPALLEALQRDYAERGIHLVKRGDKWLFETAPDLTFLLQREVEDTVRLSRAASETLAIIAYHQPTTRAEIEQIRGVAVSKGTLDVLLETGWVRPKGRRRTPGRPVTYGTTDAFLLHFGLDSLTDLPGLAELKAAGLMDADPPDDFHPQPTEDDDASATEDEESDDTLVLPFQKP